MNATSVRFGYPATLLHENGSWVVLLRPAQPMLGRLVLACKEGATSRADTATDGGTAREATRRVALKSGRKILAPR